MIVLQTAAIALFGWLAGAALNYLADVLPATRSFSAAACRHCQHADYD